MYCAWCGAVHTLSCGTLGTCSKYHSHVLPYLVCWSRRSKLKSSVSDLTQLAPTYSLPYPLAISSAPSSKVTGPQDACGICHSIHSATVPRGNVCQKGSTCMRFYSNSAGTAVDLLYVHNLAQMEDQQFVVTAACSFHYMANQVVGSSVRQSGSLQVTRRHNRQGSKLKYSRNSILQDEHSNGNIPSYRVRYSSMQKSQARLDDKSFSLSSLFFYLLRCML